MNIMPVTYIMSAYQSNSSKENNQLRHDRLKSILSQRGVPFKVVQGSYNGETETSVVVVGLGDSEVLSLAQDFNQESVLKLHSDRFAELFYSDGRVEPLGQFVATSEHDALRKRSYTYDQTTNTYYIVK